jgi:hypothetical protein
MKGRDTAICTATALILLYFGVRQVSATVVVSVGTRVPVTVAAVALPFDLSSDVHDFTCQVGVAVNPADVRVRTGCDPISDAWDPAPPLHDLRDGAPSQADTPPDDAVWAYVELAGNRDNEQQTQRINLISVNRLVGDCSYRKPI